MWSLAWSDGHRGLKDRGVGPEMDPTWYLQAQVPGEIHLDLMRQGLLEDPRTGINILKASPTRFRRSDSLLNRPGADVGPEGKGPFGAMAHVKGPGMGIPGPFMKRRH